jgi:hypothetical protein
MFSSMMRTEILNHLTVLICSQRNYCQVKNKEHGLYGAETWPETMGKGLCLLKNGDQRRRGFSRDVVSAA